MAGRSAGRSPDAAPKPKRRTSFPPHESGAPQMRVLVTGASGFIGQSLVRRLLEQGHTVRAMVRKPPLVAATKGLDYAVGDLTDAASMDRACEGMEAIVHLACATGVAD